MADATIVIAETNASVVVTSDTSATISVTETTSNITTSNVGIQGATGATGAGYSGVTSTSNLTIGTGLKTFTLVSGNSGAFVTGQRIRAIHSETPTYWMEGYANYIGGGTLIITVDLTAGSGTHNLWNFAIAGQVGATGATGATGSSGVIAVTAPITNSGTSTSAQLGIDQTGLSITPSQVAGTAVITTDSRLSDQRTPLDNSVTSAKIVNGTILNEDINASAAIDSTKISGTAAVLGSANAFTVGGHRITNAVASVVPLAIKGATSQSSNLQEWQNSGSTVVANITSSGQFVNTISIANNDYINRTNGGNARLQLLTTGATLTASVATNIILTVQNTNASPTADLTRWLNTGGSTLGGRNANAQIYTGSTTTINSGVGGATTAASGDGTTATLTMTSATNLAVGDLIVVAGVTPTGYNTTGAVVTAVSNTSPFTVSYLNATTGAQTVAGTVTTPAQASVTARSAGTTALVVKGATNQAVNLFEIFNGSGNSVTRVRSSGNFGIGGLITGVNVAINNDIVGAGTTALIIRGAASQSANLQEWQSSTPGLLTAITPTGTINFASGNTSATATAGAITAPALVTGYITMQVAGTTVKVPYYSN